MLSLFLTAVAHSAPPNVDDFVQKAGGFVDLPFGSYVEGSTRFGGIQPDYTIDQNPDLLQFLDEVQKAVAASGKIQWLQKLGMKTYARNKKIELVTALIQNALPIGSYHSKPYMDVLEEHRLKGLDISLGSYLQCKAGVCRENALLTHLALKAVGVPNEFVYIQAGNKTAREDHAIVVIEEKNEKWIIDPYNETFHGKNFIDMMLIRGPDTPLPRTASFAVPAAANARILKILPYPIYWIPRPGCGSYVQ